MNRQEYLRELRQRLAFRAVDRRRADELVAEVDSHLAESGEDPLESFGPPDRYAARLVRGRWSTVRHVVGTAATIGAGALGGAVAVAVNQGEQVRVSGGGVAAVLAILLAVLTPNLPAVRSRLPGRLGPLLLAIGVAGFGACAASVVASTVGVDDQVLLRVSRGGALAAIGGLLVLTAAALAGPYLARRLRRG